MGVPQKDHHRITAQNSGQPDLGGRGQWQWRSSPEPHVPGCSSWGVGGGGLFLPRVPCNPTGILSAAPPEAQELLQSIITLGKGHCGKP